MIEVTMDDLYEQACKALGDSTVKLALLTAELQRVTAERDALAEQVGQA